MQIHINGIDSNVGIPKITEMIRIIDSMDEVIKSCVLENEQTLHNMEEEYDEISYTEDVIYNSIGNLVSTGINNGNQMTEVINVLIGKLANIINLTNRNKEILEDIMKLINNQKISSLETLGRDTVFINRLEDTIENDPTAMSVIHEEYEGGKKKKMKTRKQRNRRKQRR